MQIYLFPDKSISFAQAMEDHAEYLSPKVRKKKRFAKHLVTKNDHKGLYIVIKCNMIQSSPFYLCDCTISLEGVLTCFTHARKHFTDPFTICQSVID